MCGRFAQSSPIERYARLFGLASQAEAAAAPRYNVAPTQPILAVRTAEHGTREILAMRWGLIPHWSQGPDNRYSMINARAESVHQRSAYRDAFRARRCLIPADGFYEWHQECSGREPYFIRMHSGEPFAFAGLWEYWQDPEGQRVDSCTIIVTEANDLVRPIHDRMPVILAPETYDTWLDPTLRDPTRLLPLLRPYPAEEMEAWRVARRVNSPRNDDPELIRRVEA